MTMRRGVFTRLGVLSTLILAAFASPTASASDTELVVEGRRSAYFDFTLSGQMVITRPADVRIRGRSPYMAIVIERLDQPRPGFRYAAVFAPAVRPEATLASGQTVMNPGRYRIRLLTAGPARVSLDVDGGGRVVRPQQSLAVTTRDGAAAVATGVSSPEIRLPRAVPRNHAALFTYATSGDARGGSYGCVTTQNECQTTPFASPSPVPTINAGSPIGLGSSGSGLALADARGDRTALFGVENAVATQAGTLRGLVLNYRP
jgi:hypothetical protein